MTDGHGVVRGPVRPDGTDGDSRTTRVVPHAFHWIPDELRRQQVNSDAAGRRPDDVMWTMTADGRVIWSSAELPAGDSGEAPDLAALGARPTPAALAVVQFYFDQLLTTLHEGRVPDEFYAELPFHADDGSPLLFEVRMAPEIGAAGQLVRIHGSAREIGCRRRRESELEDAHRRAEAANLALRNANAGLHLLAATDPLTGAWNRRYFHRIAEREVALSRRTGQPLALLMIDVDHFKLVNDRYGHEAGDLVLVGLTHRIRRRLRLSDILARWGGEEFLILAPDCSLSDAVTLAWNLQRIVARDQFPPAGAVTISIGVAQLGDDEGLDEWIKRTDQALYASKVRGRNTVRADLGHWPAPTDASELQRTADSTPRVR